MPQPVIGDLFGVKRMTINKAVRETRQLLTQVRHAIEPADMRLDTLADLAAHAAHAAQEGLDLTEKLKSAS
jgi:hypothetical protein